MKKILILIAAVLMPVLAIAQAQINTKKTKISDFTKKVTKIVLPGNTFLDGTFQDAVVSGWRVSPYEFCTMEEFKGLKGSDQYYFILLTQGQFKKEAEPGIQFITLVKGGPEAKDGIESMLEVATLPFAAADSPSGRELVYLPALLDIMQNYAIASIEKDFSVLGGLSSFATNMSKAKKMDVIFADEDLSEEITDEIIESCFNDKTKVMDIDDVDTLAEENTPETLVSYVIAPADAAPGSFCYKLLIDTYNHELYYFRKHRISKKTGAGFLAEDIKRITASRK